MVGGQLGLLAPPEAVPSFGALGTGEAHGERVRFFVPGLPATKGSARAFIAGGRPIITNDNAKAKPWASVITLQAQETMAGRAAFTGPVVVRIAFYLRRPQGHFGARGQLKPSAPRWVSTKPDVDKLTRCALDALVPVVVVDDSRIVRIRADKLYATEGESSIGAWFEITPLR